MVLGLLSRNLSSWYALNPSGNLLLEPRLGLGFRVRFSERDLGFPRRGLLQVLDGRGGFCVGDCVGDRSCDGQMIGGGGLVGLAE